MITKIELDGFKTFQNFELELGPFQVIIGPNGAGKSNLFDALRLLGRLVESNPDNYGLGQRWLGIRSDTDQAFTILPGGEQTKRIWIAVELLVDRKVKDKLGQEEEIDYQRLRYELELKNILGAGERERLVISHESLDIIPPENDNWANKFRLYEDWLKKPNLNRGKTSFISNVGIDKNISTLEENNSHLTKINNEVSLLSFVNTTEYPHALAVKQEIESWKFLELHPFYAKKHKTFTGGPSFYMPNIDYATATTLDLPEILFHFKADDPFLLNDIVRDLINLVPEIVKIEVRLDPLRGEKIIFATTRDGRELPWQSLSDGTLRLLALAILNNDPNFEGLLCIEEPENGVHPFVLKNMARLLKNMATDFSDKEQALYPLRQVLITTHSPVLVSQKEVIGSVLFAYLVTKVGNKYVPPQRITHIEPVRTGRHTKTNADSTTENTYTLYQVKKYLESAGSSEALDILEGKA